MRIARAHNLGKTVFLLLLKLSNTLEYYQNFCENCKNFMESLDPTDLLHSKLCACKETNKIADSKLK